MIKRTLIGMWLFAGIASANTVNLQWNKNPEIDVTGYYVFRAATSGGYNFNLPLNTSPVPNPANGPVIFADTTAPNAVWYYVIKAVNSAGVQGPPSNEAVANALGPSAPTGLTVTSVTASNLNMSVNGVQVASGPPPLMFTIPRQSPPRSYAILVQQAP